MSSSFIVLPFVFIHNIFFEKGITIPVRLSQRFKKSQESRFIFYLLLLSTQYNQSAMLSKYVANIIKKTKNHLMVIKKFINFVEFYFFKHIINFLGLQLRVTGKLGGKMRKSKYHYKLGKVCLQSLKIGLSYSCSISYTKFGLISVKIWLLHADKYI